MVCSACQDKPKKPCGACGKLPPVLQINSEECPVLFHTTELAGLPTDEGNEPYIGRYRNTLLVYKGDDSKWLFNSDGIPSKLTKDLGDIDFNRLFNRPKYDGVEMTGETNIPNVETTVSTAVAAEAEARAAADTALGGRIDTTDGNLAAEVAARVGADTTLQGNISAEATTRANADTAMQGDINNINTALNTEVMTELVVDPNTSTTVVQLDTTKKNLKTSVTTTGNVPLPVANATQAGVMNSATYQAITDNTANINALINGAVAVTGLPADLTQQQLTTAWETATGISTLMNRAGIYDVTNQKVWTYYVNDTTWHAASNTSQVTINTFTNTSEGIIKGSTNVGQVFAENDGTGSVNGWDALVAEAANATSKLATIASGAEVNVQSNWAETDTTSDAYIQNKPVKDTALSSTSTNVVENQAIDAEFDKVAYKGNTVATPSDIAIISTNNIQDGAVTADKINFNDFAYTTGTKHQIGTTSTGTPMYEAILVTTIPANTTTSEVVIPTTLIPLNAKVFSLMSTNTNGSDVNAPYYNSSSDYRRDFLRKSNTNWTQQFRLSSTTNQTIYRTRIVFFE